MSSKARYASAFIATVLFTLSAGSYSYGEEFEKDQSGIYSSQSEDLFYLPISSVSYVDLYLLPGATNTTQNYKGSKTYTDTGPGSAVGFLNLKISRFRTEGKKENTKYCTSVDTSFQISGAYMNGQTHSADSTWRINDGPTNKVAGDLIRVNFAGAASVWIETPGGIKSAQAIVELNSKDGSASFAKVCILRNQFSVKEFEQSETSWIVYQAGNINNGIFKSLEGVFNKTNLSVRLPYDALERYFAPIVKSRQYPKKLGFKTSIMCYSDTTKKVVSKKNPSCQSPFSENIPENWADLIETQ